MSAPRPQINEQSYMQINNGMILAEVEAILCVPPGNYSHGGNLFFGTPADVDWLRAEPKQWLGNHCHILDHEDRGMMDLVTIRASAATAGAAPPAVAQPPFAGAPSVYLFVQGSYCPHCMAQVASVAEMLVRRSI